MTFTWRLFPKCADPWLLLDVLITAECAMLWSLPLSELPSPEEGEPLGKPLGILGALCHLHCLPHSTECWVQASLVLLTFPIGHSLIQASHPIIYITGASWGPDGSPWPWGAPQAPGLHFLLHDSICNGLNAFLHCICGCFHLHCSTGPTNWTCQAESNAPCTGIWELLFAQSSSKEQDGFPRCQDHSFSDLFIETILEHVGN